jgi:hypothetical protein
MNIFYLDEDPKICAQYHCDKHVVKMIIEYAQLLSTAHRVLDGFEGYGASKSGNRQVKIWTLHDSSDDILYKAAYVNHPSNVWVRQSGHNYNYLWTLWHYLCLEYSNRYNNKKHSTYEKLKSHLSQIPQIYSREGFKEPPLCMPDECKRDDAVTAYRSFYRSHKREFATWKNQVPDWFI